MAPSERRQYVRVPTDITLDLQTKDGKTFSTQKVENVSLGGVFAHMANPLPFGTELTLHFSIGDPPQRIRCTGFVVWIRKPGSAEGPAGIGIRLGDISIADMRALAAYIEQVLMTLIPEKERPPM
jgi:uncharacterized protein (TIGR02266 family)